MVFLLAVANTATAQPECKEAQSSDKPDITTKRIHIYIESDMHAEMAAKGSVPSTMQFRQIRTAIMQAAEAWNTSTRAVSLIYKGKTNLDPLEFCNSTLGDAGTEYSVLYVNFGANTEGASFTVRTITDCTKPNVNELIIRGETSGGSTRTFSSGSNGVTLSNSLVHEMGHVIGLGHVTGASSIETCYSIMNSHSSANNPICANNNIANGGRFPIRTDKDCSRLSQWTGSNGKVLELHGKTWTSAGVSKTLGSLSSANSRQRSFQGRSRSTTNGRRYSLYLDSLMLTASVGSDGILPWSLNTISSPQHAELYLLDDAPVLYRLEEFSYTSEPMRFIFLDDEFDSSGGSADPPYVQFYRTRHDATGTPFSSDISYDVCTTYYCTSWSVFRAHLPPALTYDPVSGRTIHVTVQTQSLDSQDGDGQIRVHAGLRPGTTDRLTVPYNVSSLSAPNSPITGWNYRNRTEVIPSVACADFSTYNCVVAWNESGAHDGAFLYVYFRVYPGLDYIQFDPAGVRTFYSFLESASGPALSFFADKLWFAVREYDSDIQIYNSSTPGSWSYSGPIVASDVVGPPSFSVHENNETALVYAVSE